VTGISASRKAPTAVTPTLKTLNIRPPLGTYLKDLWQRRHFVRVFAAAQAESNATGNYLGRYWFILSPILSAATYWFVFGVLLGATKGIENFVAYLIIGLFLYSFTAASMSMGATSIAGSATLIQSLHFPRASVPLSTTVILLYRLRWELLVMAAIVLITGEPITWWWLLLPAVIAMQTVFNAGLGLILARLCFQTPDIKQLLPFITRILMFLSGVMFSIETYAANAPRWVQFLLEINPLAIYLNLGREVLMESHNAPPGSWWMGAVWAVGTAVFGFVYFWRAEASYGRS